ncbi:MAG: FxsA family protein [Solirubrobacterales bacterium]|nr:FxsA family protein [Solirubrobacterales bacterium]
MLFLVLLVLWPIAELLVALQVAHAIGVLETVGLLVAGWPLGSWLLRSEGRAAWRRFTGAVASERAPAHEAINGALVVLGGLLVIVPGFITDALGALMLLPPIRALGGRALRRHAQSRLLTSAARFSRRPPSVNDVDSTAHDIHRTRLHR